MATVELFIFFYERQPSRSSATADIYVDLHVTQYPITVVLLWQYEIYGLSRLLGSVILSFYCLFHGLRRTYSPAYLTYHKQQN